MKKWQLVSLLSIFFLVLVFIAQKSNNVPVLPESVQSSQSPHISNKDDVVTTTAVPVSDVNPIDTSMIKETWFSELSDSDRMTISTLDDGMQRTYKPTDRLFFNDSNALLEFFYRNFPNISQTEIMKIKKTVIVRTKADQTTIPFTVTAFDELNSQGISIHLNNVPKADLVVQFHALDGSTTKEFTFEYMPLFTYQIQCPEDKEADFYAMNPGTFFRVAPEQTYAYQVHFSLEVNKDEALKLMQNQMKDFDWSSEWKSGRDLIITLRTHPQDMYKKFLINFNRIRSTEGYVLADWHVSLHGVITDAKKYESIDVATGKVTNLFLKQPRYQTLDLSPNRQFYLATELQDDFQGEFPVPSLTLLDINGNIIKHFASQVKFPHWLADGQSFVYVSGDSILSYSPDTERTKVVWTSPYKGIKTFYYSFDSLELDQKTGRIVVSINHLPGLVMDIGNVDLYLFANINDPSPRKVENVSKRGNSSFIFQFDGNHIFYSNNFVGSQHWESKLQLLDWKNMKITDLNGFTASSYLHLYQGGEFVYQKGYSKNVEWFRYDLENEQSRKLFIVDHPIDAAWSIGKGDYIMHDFTGTFKFNIQKPQFEKISLLPQSAEILGSQENTIIYLQNPDPVGSM
ncbi:hypothetical protein [Paenibacillus sp. GP183]|uniref:hypothetical protein n=1 Tax=Paenibacillus sp. GP183 TaxID=1882751 RepID=UPI00089BF9D9|nr:hypothetical protein [Paenibacillus sp. GP183]SEB45586.1 hypothetical protein SAMN05443246_0446 [Paenibacillus sp. GP183]